eukprot:Rmarinus@m.6902
MTTGTTGPSCTTARRVVHLSTKMGRRLLRDPFLHLWTTSTLEIGHRSQRSISWVDEFSVTLGALSAAEVYDMYASYGYESDSGSLPPIFTSPSLRFVFSEEYGCLFSDSSGNNFNAYSTSTDCYWDMAGCFGSQLCPYLEDSAIDIPSGAFGGLRSSGSVTLSLWAKASVTSSDYFFLFSG